MADKRNKNGVDPQQSPYTINLRLKVNSETIPESPQMSIKRLAYNLPQFQEYSDPIQKKRESHYEMFRKYTPDMSKEAMIKRLYSLFPILSWLPKYDIKKNIIADIIVGITICTFQVPQSMGYCLIAHVPPVHGLYSAFFPALMYIFLGTSRHSAIGLFAIVSGVMTGNTVVEVSKELGRKVGYITPKPNDGLVTTQSPDAGGIYPDVVDVDIAIILAALIGVMLLVAGLLRLGFISNYLSEQFVSGFSTSASIYVFTSQLRYLFGLDLAYNSGPLALIRTYIELFSKIKDVNVPSVVISIICISILLLFKLFINEQIKKRLKIKTPFPIDLCVVIGGIIASHVMDLESKEYGVHIVGNIPNGFPPFELPKLKLISYVWSKAIPVALVGYTITLSVGKIYGEKHSYAVSPSQEMIAMGAVNVWASFFRCIPSAASLPRSALQETAGGKTQIVSVVNCFCMVFVILWLGPLLEKLPTCVLASCIAVALVSLIVKMKEFLRYWRVSKLDAAIWMVTFLGVMILDVDYGLYIGFGCNLALLIYKSQRPKTYLLGSVDSSDVYVPINKFNKGSEINGIKIYQFCGPLHFANIEYFKSDLTRLTRVDVNEVKEFLEKMKNINERSGLCLRFRGKRRYSAEDGNDDVLRRNNIPNKSKASIKTKIEDYDLPKNIIIDCSMFSYIDTSGVTALKTIVKHHNDIGIVTSLAGCPIHIIRLLEKDGFFKEVPAHRVYISIHDAVLHALNTETPTSSVFVNDAERNGMSIDLTNPSSFS